MEEAQKIVDNALNACNASDALEALNIGVPKRNLRSRINKFALPQVSSQK